MVVRRFAKLQRIHSPGLTEPMAFMFFYIPFSWSDERADLYIEGIDSFESQELLQAVESGRIDSVTISEMHSDGDGYANVGECISLTAESNRISLSAIIRKPNTILKVHHNVLNGFSVKYSPERQCIVGIAVIDRPTFQDEEDFFVWQANELKRQIPLGMDPTDFDSLGKHF